MKNITTVSIGIPAYNESTNIKKLLLSILAQTENDFKIVEIIVISDGSTDATINKVGAISSKKIKLVTGKERIGKSARLDQIFKMFKGEVLFLTDADIIITDNLLISKILASVSIKKSGLIGINGLPHKSSGIFRKIMKSGLLATYEIGKRWRTGNNYLLFKGCFLGLSQAFAKSIDVPNEIVNNDAYLYFAARDKGLQPKFIDQATIYFKTPRNFSDHLKQSNRFKNSKLEMQKYFKFDLKPEYDIPKSVYFFTFIKCFFSNPINFSAYFFINVLSRFRKESNIGTTWSIALSTKK